MMDTETVKQRGFIPVLIIILVSFLAATGTAAVAISKRVDLPKVTSDVFSNFVQPTINNVTSFVTSEISTISQNQGFVPAPLPTETARVSITPSPVPTAPPAPTPLPTIYVPVVKCLGADGLYSTVTQDVCSSVKKFWDAHPTSTTSTSITSTSDSSSTPTPTATPQPVTDDLTSLVISGSPSNYTYSAGTYEYTGVTVLNAASSVTITPTGSGIITVDGTEVVSGEASGAIALTTGVEKTITVIATETDKSAKTYTINITRGSPVQYTSGPLSPSTMADSAAVGSVVWTDPDSAKLNDSSYAMALGGWTLMGGIQDTNVKIVKSSGSIGTTNKAYTTTDWGIEEYVSYGSSSDLWGETWTPSDINNANFGVVISVETSHYLKATNFGYSIPTGATVDGISIEIEKKAVSGVGSGQCILEGSNILTPDGYKKIEDLVSGDKILSFNEARNIVEEDIVHQTFSFEGTEREIYYVYVVGLNDAITTSNDHVFYTTNGLKRADMLSIDDYLYNSALEELKISGIEVQNINGRIFDLVIQNNHNFFVNDILVHNPVLNAHVNHIRATVYYTY
jgi:hypothetical protein